MKLIPLILLLILSSCASSYSTYEPFEIEIKNLIIHISPNKDNFPKDCQYYDSSLRHLVKSEGCAYPNDIWVVGKLNENKEIKINYEILGHEIAHILNWKDGIIVNPDKRR